MHTIHLTAILALLSFIALVTAHARIKHPRPLAAPDDSPAGNFYNAPLRPDGSEFPCKGLHKKVGVNKAPTETWQAGRQARFEILGHNTPGGEGSLAAHSGGSCQASLSFDNGETWKALHTYQGGCPRDVRLGSNIAGKNQTFTFDVPENTKAGNALFSWTWIAVTGNRNEFYQNCASVTIVGSGTSTLDNLPDMFVGDMTLAGHIGPGECRSTAGYALDYPNPGEAITITKVESIPFKKPSAGKCFAKPSSDKPTTPAPSTTIFSVSPSSSAAPSTQSSGDTAGYGTSSMSSTSVKSTTSTASATSTIRTTSAMSTVPATPVTLTMSTTSAAASSLPPQCSTYMLITDRTRHSTYHHYIGCDNAIFKSSPTWVRFSGAAGTLLAAGPIEPFRCGTQGTGWYSGIYPSSAGATTSGTVCYSWPGNKCQWSNPISITNCNDYYVFALRAPPACFLRYCTT